MNILLLVLAAMIILFGFVVLFGAPYLPTLKKQTKTALDLLDLKEGQTILELGCGDGRVLKAAAQRGQKAVGYELNPLLVIIAWFNTFGYRNSVTIIWGNYWTKAWPEADGVFVFLLDKYMEKLDKKIMQQYPDKKIKLVSFAFRIPNKKPAAKKDALYLYIYG